MPIEETLRAYEELIASGKVRAIGASNYSPAQLVEALDASEAQGLPRYETLQPWYNLYDRADYENGPEGVCLERGLGVISYFGLASGFLSGKYRSEADLAGRPRAYRVKNYLNDRGYRILAALDAVGAEHRSDAGAGRARLADGAAEHHRADRERNQRRAARRADRRGTAAASSPSRCNGWMTPARPRPIRLELRTAPSGCRPAGLRTHRPGRCGRCRTSGYRRSGGRRRSG